MGKNEWIYRLTFVVVVAVLVVSTLHPCLLERPKWRQIMERWGFAEPQPHITFSNTQVRPGDFFVLTIEPLGPNQEVAIKSRFLLEPPLLFPHGKGVRGLIPLTYRTIPGTYPFEVTVTSKGRTIHREEREIEVEKREFAIQKMYVSQELHARRDGKLRAEDHVFTEQSRKEPITEALWEGAFIMPVVGRITTGFGQIRMINDVDGGRHSGLDLLASIGTPILAGNHGVVVLARPLNVTGNTVILDHGLNLFSSYSHLDEITVEVGQKIKKGEMVGTAGNTGFSTAPHLHWALSVGAVFVDPDLFLAGDPL